MFKTHHLRHAGTIHAQLNNYKNAQEILHSAQSVTWVYNMLELPIPENAT